ncbi:MAG: hypothetical protein R3E53_17645 [Myxococcota bacterium]
MPEFFTFLFGGGAMIDARRSVNWRPAARDGVHPEPRAGEGPLIGEEFLDI